MHMQPSVFMKVYGSITLQLTETKNKLKFKSVYLWFFFSQFLSVSLCVKKSPLRGWGKVE